MNNNNEFLFRVNDEATMVAVKTLTSQLLKNN